LILISGIVVIIICGIVDIGIGLVVIIVVSIFGIDVIIVGFVVSCSFSSSSSSSIYTSSLGNIQVVVDSI
jgi:hypothetical protein